MNNTSGFGKEIGLLHEVIITGRKVGAGVTTYSFLASNEVWLKRFSNLSRHLSVMYKSGVKPVGVDQSDIENLVREINVITNGDCVVCNMANGEGREEALKIFAPQDVIDAHSRASKLTDGEKQQSRQQHFNLFHEWLEKRFASIGIDPAEVAEFCPQYYQDFCYWENYPQIKGWMFSRNDCCQTKEFTDTIELIAKQRNVLSVLEGL